MVYQKHPFFSLEVLCLYKVCIVERIQKFESQLILIMIKKKILITHTDSDFIIVCSTIYLTVSVTSSVHQFVYTYMLYILKYMYNFSHNTI